jgi:hypothetical protein
MTDLYNNTMGVKRGIYSLPNSSSLSTHVNF